MPNFKTHLASGVGSAVVVAAVTIDSVPQDMRLFYCLGLAIGGAIGGTLPDQLEPALHPHHRQFFHSLAVLAGVGHQALATGSLVASGVSCWQEEAARLRVARARSVPSSPECQRLYWREGFYHLATGLVRGGLAGYSTHLVLDARTTFSLPLLGTLPRLERFR